MNLIVALAGGRLAKLLARRPRWALIQNWISGTVLIALGVSLLAVVLAALLSGVWLTARAIRREWEFSRLQSDFVATVSHEFRSPLTGIRQLAELLDSGIVHADNRRREYYRLILQESDRLTHLVRNT